MIWSVCFCDVSSEGPRYTHSVQMRTQDHIHTKERNLGPHVDSRQKVSIKLSFQAFGSSGAFWAISWKHSQQIRFGVSRPLGRQHTWHMPLGWTEFWICSEDLLSNCFHHLGPHSERRTRNICPNLQPDFEKAQLKSQI